MREHEIELWIEVAKHDIETADLLINNNGYPDIIIYHYHQALEKILKGILLKYQEETPKTHYLDKLIFIISGYFKGINEKANGVLFIHKFLPILRYPSGDTITITDALEVKKYFYDVLNYLIDNFEELGKINDR